MPDRNKLAETLSQDVNSALREVGREKQRDVDPPALFKAEQKLAKAEARYSKWMNGRCYD